MIYQPGARVRPFSPVGGIAGILELVSYLGAGQWLVKTECGHESIVAEDDVHPVEGELEKGV